MGRNEIWFETMGKQFHITAPCAYSLKWTIPMILRKDYLGLGDIRPLGIVDVGAHIGTLTIYFALNYPQAEVYALEPVVENFKHLVNNTSDFKNIHLMKIAAHSTKGKIMLGIPEGDNRENTGLMSVYGETDTEEVEADTLDNLFAGKDIDLIKIDAEGDEYAILQGARELIARCRPIIYIETLHVKKNMMDNIISSLGYTLQAQYENDSIFVPEYGRNE